MRNLQRWTSPSTPGQHTLAPAFEFSLTSHGKHESTLAAPVLPLYRPGGHSKQLMDRLLPPGDGLYLPVGQGYSTPFTQYSPAGHARPEEDTEPASHSTPARTSSHWFIPATLCVCGGGTKVCVRPLTIATRPRAVACSQSCHVAIVSHAALVVLPIPRAVLSQITQQL